MTGVVNAMKNIPFQMSDVDKLICILGPYFVCVLCLLKYPPK